ncbi:MAG TPA: metallophosphoesterase [Chitinophagales bacterium]|nr:metallophosphoesterase [Chitinophagales bacterium]
MMVFSSSKTIIAGITGLLFFSVSGGCEKLERIKSEVPPVVVAAATAKFAVIGDYGDAGEPERRVAQMVKEWNPDFIITTGDNNYDRGEESTLNENIGQYYCDFIWNYDAPINQRCNGKAAQDRQNRFFPSPGNHDFNRRNKLVPYLNYFTLPGEEVYYEFIWGPVHFFSLFSGEDGNPFDCCEQQYYWLKEKLSSSDRPWKVVYFHHSTYSTANHGSNHHLRWPFKEWGASAVLSGHDHVYSRIIQKSTGFPYFINGLGGRSKYGCREHPLDENDFEVFCFNDDYGAMLVTANDTAMRFKFFSVSNPALPVDEFVLKTE